MGWGGGGWAALWQGQRNHFPSRFHAGSEASGSSEEAVGRQEAGRQTLRSGRGEQVAGVQDAQRVPGQGLIRPVPCRTYILGAPVPR